MTTFVTYVTNCRFTIRFVYLADGDLDKRNFFSRQTSVKKMRTLFIQGIHVFDCMSYRILSTFFFITTIYLIRAYVVYFIKNLAIIFYPKK